MKCRVAVPNELEALAVLCWHMHAESTVPSHTCDEFVPDFLAWAAAVAPTHTPFVAIDQAPVGMAWLARVPRPPRPGALRRAHGDVQSVYVTPEHRNQGVGELLLRTLLRHAWDQGMAAVTVSSGRRALPLYQRLGFTADPLDLRLTPARA